MSVRISTQKKAPSEAQQAEIDKLDLTPLRYLKDLLEASKTKQEPKELNLQKSQIYDGPMAGCVERGQELLRGGNVGVMILAGGAATRLGADVPKGQYQLGLEGGSCLFEILFNLLKQQHEPRVFIMLSNQTAESVQFLKAKKFFGYQEAKVQFCMQPEYPVFTEHGDLLLDQHGSIQTSPNGNGGFLKALEVLNLSGLEYLHVIGVDNPFVKPADSEMIGWASINNLAVVNRVLRPRVGEKVGIVGQRAIEATQQAPLSADKIKGLLQQPCATVFEYSEIDVKKIRPEEQLGNIANHLFCVDFLTQLIEIQKATQTYITPYHLAFKKVPYLDLETHSWVVPDAPNAYKVEHFIFDVFHFCPLARFGLFVCPRDEFLPIKEPQDVEAVKRMWGAK